MEKNYKYLRFLGQGGFGKVYLCHDKNNQFVCIKELKFDESYNKSILREIYILSQLNHPRIVRFIEYFMTNETNTMNIVLEFAPAGSLREYIDQQKTRISSETVVNIFMDILMGLEYLHIRHVIHGDLKPENLLLSANRRIKICDFGISTVYGGSRFNGSGVAGTVLYIAPEVAHGIAPNFKSDIWSLGCIFYELCALKRAFHFIQSFAHLKEIFRNWRKESWDCECLSYSDKIKYLCSCMLTFDPNKRISIPEIISIEFIWPKYYTMYFDYGQNSL